MEQWFIYSLLASFFIGIGGFLQKIEIERNLSKTSFITYAHLGIVIGILLYLLIFGKKLDFSFGAVFYGLLLSSIYVTIFRFRLKSLEYISSSSYFINYRLFSSSLLLIMGQIFYNENISLYEYLGVFLGFVIFYLLVEKRVQSETQKQMRKGYLYLMIGIIGIVTIWVLQKKMILLDVDFATYIFISGINGTLLPLLLKEKQETISAIFYIKEKKDRWLLFFAAFISPFSMLFNLLAVDTGGDIGVVYKIVSYSLFIPIILSIIIYKEKVTVKKFIAFILTLLSIGLFI